MAPDPSPLKPQCDEALHEIYHLLSGEIDDHKRAKIAAAPRRVLPLRGALRLLRRAAPSRAAELPRHRTPELLARIEEAIQHEPHD